MAAPTPQVDLKALAWDGARLILQETLSLNAGDRVALFHDEQGVAIANLFGEVARSLRLRYEARFVPAAKQAIWAGRGGMLPIDDMAWIDPANGVLVCLSGDLQTASYGRQLVERAAVDQRVAGLLSPALPALAHASRYRQDAHPVQCGDLALILLAGTEAELTTAVLDARGDIIEDHCLTLSLGGFARCPVTAGGPIPAGTWAPVPAAEVCIAPIEATASGVFVLNGPIAGGASSGDEHLLLVFASGRLEMVGGNSPRVGEFWRVVESGKSHGTPLSLASLGIRLGSSGDTAGNSVLLSLGDNTALGGSLTSPIQEVLLSRGGSLKVDGQWVLREGRLVYDVAAWQETRATAQTLAAAMSGELTIRRTRNIAHADALGQLGVIRHVGRQRACTYRLGDADLSARLSDLYQLLAEQTGAITLCALSRLCLPGPIAAHLAELRGLLGVLERHELIEVTRL